MSSALIARARALAKRPGRSLLGVVGPPGAGKSAVTSAIVDGLRADGICVAWVPMDGFHLAQAELEKRGLRDVMGRIDTFDADGYLALLRRLRDEPDQRITAPDFDRVVEEPVADAIVIGPDVQLVVTEGNYLLDTDEPWPQARATLDEVWFVDLPDEARLERLIRRHVEFGKTEVEARRWVEQVDEPNAGRVRARRASADLVVLQPQSSVIRRLGEPGDLGWVVMAHGRSYAEQFGWNVEFEALVARIVADYANDHHADREVAWIAEVDGERVGCIFCVAQDAETARLRLLLVEPAGRGRGLGDQLVQICVQLARHAGYRTITLWTNDVLASARRIYEVAGFELVQQERHHSFGYDLVGQYWSLDLSVS